MFLRLARPLFLSLPQKHLQKALKAKVFFFETLAGVFTGSQKAEKAVTQTASTDAKTDVSATEGETVEKNGESQESVANRESVDGKAADALLEHEA